MNPDSSVEVTPPVDDAQTPSSTGRRGIITLHSPHPPFSDIPATGSPWLVHDQREALLSWTQFPPPYPQHLPACSFSPFSNSQNSRTRRDLRGYTSEALSFSRQGMSGLERGKTSPRSYSRAEFTLRDLSTTPHQGQFSLNERPKFLLGLAAWLLNSHYRYKTPFTLPPPSHCPFPNRNLQEGDKFLSPKPVLCKTLTYDDSATPPQIQTHTQPHVALLRECGIW